MAIAFDSRPATWEHIDQVRARLQCVIENVLQRMAAHDQSKLVAPEVEAFDEFTPKLGEMVYGSEEYRECLRQMKPALTHHYAHNSHHPEHYGDEGIAGMTLLDLVEMLCDWSAAAMRGKDGDIRKSLEMNQKRFGYGDELAEIFENTISELLL